MILLLLSLLLTQYATRGNQN